MTKCLCESFYNSGKILKKTADLNKRKKND